MKLEEIKTIYFYEKIWSRCSKGGLYHSVRITLNSDRDDEATYCIPFRAREGGLGENELVKFICGEVQSASILHGYGIVVRKGFAEGSKRDVVSWGQGYPILN